MVLKLKSDCTRQSRTKGTNRMKALLITLIASLALGLGIASTAQAKALYFPSLSSGSPGPWLGTQSFTGDLDCTGPAPYQNAGRFVTLNRQEIGRSPMYTSSNQDIYMQARLDWSTNGATWYVYERKPWQVQRVAPGYSSYALFNQAEFNVSAYRGYMWRVRVEYRWYVGSTWLGTAVHGFSQDGIFVFGSAERGTLSSTGEGICRIN